MSDLVKFFAALADPTRLRLLALVKNGETCVCHLQEVIETNQPKISRHLAYLKKAGLVRARREGKWIYYRLASLKEPQASILAQVLQALNQQSPMSQDAKRLDRVRCSKEKSSDSFQKSRKSRISELPARGLKSKRLAVGLKG